ncbi:MAG: alpha/beta hydrolase [Bdellovibrionales bacterium]|nr:alpha/beta hydrolase [Bdellovibrionales bacterium]
MFVRKTLFFMCIFLISCAHVPLQAGGEESVIVVHGFARRARSMNQIATAVHQAGYEVRNVDYDSINKNLNDIKEEIYSKFDQYIFENPGKKIHFIGHSLGGLLVRAYLAENKLDNLGVVILMGTPNKGTQLVNQYEDKWYFSWLGPVIPELGVGNSQFLDALQMPDYTVGVIAGSKPYSRRSAKYLEGDHDGLVTVESAKLEGMHDFIEIEVNHSRMKRDPIVIEQVIYFLENSQFKK